MLEPATPASKLWLAKTELPLYMPLPIVITAIPILAAAITNSFSLWIDAKLMVRLESVLKISRVVHSPNVLSIHPKSDADLHMHISMTFLNNT